MPCRGDVLGIFLLPPSKEEIVRRLGQRGADDASEVAKRLAEADLEMSHAGEFDHVVVNDVLDDAVAEVRGHLERRRSSATAAMTKAG
jgi:guanylate kinase